MLIRQPPNGPLKLTATRFRRASALGRHEALEDHAPP
jgi:hypothetical protein